MSPELQIAKYLDCIICGKKLVREDSSKAFYYCRGGKYPHEIYLVNARFDNEKGTVQGAAEKLSKEEGQK